MYLTGVLGIGLCLYLKSSGPVSRSGDVHLQPVPEAGRGGAHRDIFFLYQRPYVLRRQFIEFGIKYYCLQFILSVQ
jgi:hypothetical protein